MTRELTAVLAGMKRFGTIVEAAYGPAGRRVQIDKSFGPPTRTWKASVVARELDVYLENRDEAFGLVVAKESASTAHARSVDGSSLAVLLGQGLVEALSATPDRDALLAAVDAVRSQLRERAQPLGDRLPQVISSAACGDAAVEALIREACANVDPSVVAIVSRDGASSRVVRERGYVLEGGWLTPEFATNMSDPNQPLCELEHPLVVGFAEGCKQEDARSVLDAMRAAHRAKRPLLLLAPEYHPEIESLVRNANHTGRFFATGASVATFPEEAQALCKLLENELPQTSSAATCLVPEGPLDTCVRALISRKATRLTGAFGSELVTIEWGKGDATIDANRLGDALAAGRLAKQGIVMGGGLALEAAARAASIDPTLFSVFERPRRLLNTHAELEGLWDPLPVVDSALTAAKECLMKVTR